MFGFAPVHRLVCELERVRLGQTGLTVPSDRDYRIITDSAKTFLHLNADDAHAGQNVSEAKGASLRPAP